MTRINNFWTWYKCTSFPLGLIALGVLLALSARSVGATVTCAIAEYKCEYAIKAQDAIAESMSELVVNNPNVDIVTKKRR